MLEILGIGVLLALVFVGAFIYDVFSWGFVFYKFWYWFVLPVFNTHTLLNVVNPLPEVTFYQSIGLMCFLMLFKNQTANLAKREYRDEKANMILNIISPIFVFIFGWVVYVWLLKP